MKPAPGTRYDHSIEQHISKSQQGKKINEVGIAIEPAVIQCQGDEHGNQPVADPVNLFDIKAAKKASGRA